MIRQSLVISAIAAAVAATVVSAQERSSDSDLANAEHLEILNRHVERLSMTLSGKPSRRIPQLLQPPVMRSSNKGENHDGAVWLWLDGAQPVAVLSAWNRGPVWYSENTTLTEEAFEVTGWTGVAWQSPSEPRHWFKQDDPVGDSAAIRQRTLRDISRRFSAREDRQGVKSELRLLPRPIHSYADPDRGVVEGVLFAFVLGTDPELFMQIEARKSGGEPKWQVAFARMASAELGVRTAEGEIWTVAAVPDEYKKRHDLGYCMVVERSQ
jgi:hypothetical protein